MKVRYNFKTLRQLTTIISMVVMLSSCLSGSKNGAKRTKSNAISNTSNSVDYNYGRVLRVNPTLFRGDYNLSANINLNEYLVQDQDYITSNSTLSKNCSFGSSFSVNSCFKVYNSLNNTTPLTPTDGKWAFDANSDQFLQVNTFYHISNATDRFLDGLASAASYSAYGFYDSAISSSMGSKLGYWYYDANSVYTLSAYSKCMKLDNAYFDPANFLLCFGESIDQPGLNFAQDPSVIYHELGHAFIHLMFNSRNTVYDYGNNTDPIRDRSRLGAFVYDEALSINEGLSDYFAYIMTARTHMGEWAMKEFPGSQYLASDRPMSEDDPAHIPGISTDSESRLSYPTYLQYDTALPDEPIEDVHFAGQITSHFLVALTKDLMNTCSFAPISTYNSLYAKANSYPSEHIGATRHVLYAIAETLSELGDLSAIGGDNYIGTENFVNLTREGAYVWAHINNPPNYRKFFQTFSRYLLNINSFICPSYTQTQLEKLLDDYGLLLFKSYNNNGSDKSNGHAGSNTQVSSSNRIKTVLIDKDLLDFPDGENPTQAYIVDSQASMREAIKTLTFNGNITSISDNLYDDLRYNNNNSKISPGEVVGIALNLVNHSNSVMAGVQVLGNDWDHMKEDGTISAPNLKPCSINGWPNATEGTASADNDPAALEGDCGYITRENGTNSVVETAEQISPICFVQYRDENETLWMSQNNFRKKIPIDDAQCLHPDDPDSCLIRVLPGADSAFYSKIDPQKNFLQTLQGDNSEVPSMKYSNLIMMEVSRDIPPGTKFNCRFRVRFSNCSNCYTDPDDLNKDDFLDYEFAGPDPFKIINLQFTVIN